MNSPAKTDYEIITKNNQLIVNFKTSNSENVVSYSNTYRNTGIGLSKLLINGEAKYYYLRDDGSVYCGLMKDENDNVHYFHSNGEMVFNATIKSSNGDIYVINELGEIVQDNLTDKQKQELYTYCGEKLYTANAFYNPELHAYQAYIYDVLSNQYKQVVGLARFVKEDGVYTYYFDSLGRLMTGWQNVNGQKMYFDPGSGKLISVD